MRTHLNLGPQLLGLLIIFSYPLNVLANSMPSKPVYIFKLSGSGTFGIRNFQNGMTGPENGASASTLGFGNGNSASIWTFGAYGYKSFILKAQGDLLLGALQIGSMMELSIDNSLGNIVFGNTATTHTYPQQLSSAAHQQNRHSLTARLYDVHLSHPRFGFLSLGVDRTMSADAAGVSYSKQGSEIAYDFNAVKLVKDPSSFDGDFDNSSVYLFHFISFPAGQNITDRIEYRLKFKGLSVGLSYVPQRFKNYELGYSVLEGSKGVGAIYEVPFDKSKFKFGFSYATEIGLGSAKIGSSSSALSQAGFSEWTRSGNTLSVSAATIANGVDFSMSAGIWNPYNNRAADIEGNIADEYTPATSLLIKLGYAHNFIASGETHFGVRHRVIRNAFQSSGEVAGNKSSADLIDVGVTQSIGNAEIYSGITRIYHITAHSQHDLGFGDDRSSGSSGELVIYNNKEQKLQSLTGFVTGLKYSF